MNHRSGDAPTIFLRLLARALPLAAIPLSLTAASMASETTTDGADEERPIVYRAYYPLDDSRPDPPVHATAIGQITAEQTLRSFLASHTGMDYAESRRRAIELIRLAPDRFEGYYNLSCSLARLRRTDEAFDALERAVERGWRDAVHTSLDPDLHPLRSHERFGQIVDDIRQRRRAEKLTCNDLRTTPVDAVIAELESNVEDWLKRYQVPGVTIALIRDHTVTWTGAYGTRSKHDAEAVTANDRCRLSAVHDFLITLTALELQQRGDLDVMHLLAEADAHGWRGGDTPLRTRSITDDPHQRSSARTTADRWPRTRVIPGTVAVLETAIEAIEDQAIDAVCTRTCLSPLEMRDTAIVRARPLGVAQVAADAGDRPGEQARPVGVDVLDSSPLAVVLHGHTSLGTPLATRAPGPLDHGPLVETNAADLARLLVRASEAQLDDAEPRMDLFELNDNLRARGKGLGVEIQLQQTQDGPRIQIGELRRGVGCLARLYAESGDGIVVLFNSENGRDVALRIAQLAIGGH